MNDIEKNNLYYILLYYCYTPINNPDDFREIHHLRCLELGLRGRIIIAGEGINGTVSGSKEACMAYMDDFKKSTGFEKIHFKIAKHHQHAFKKLHVRVKDEIVNAGLHHIDPNQQTGKHIGPKDFEAIKDQENVVVLDVRSNYEHGIGTFKDAVTLDINNFREFKDKIHELEPYRDKKVITFCTGGIKCEKASAYLLEKGFKDVYQLHGGIINYGLETKGKDFEGKCYVFDNRLTTTINRTNPTTKGICYICKVACDRMINCANPWCNLHIPICNVCGEKLKGACSTTCMDNPDKRNYDGTGYYIKNSNGYNAYKGLKRNKE